MVVLLRRALFSELDSWTLYKILQLRATVFVVEQNCSYQDLDDLDTASTTTHFWLETPQGEVASYLRVLKEAPDAPNRISRVVTSPNHRGKGHAVTLMNTAKESYEKPIVLFAESYLKQWYGKQGFTVTGSEFFIDAIPHLPMRYE